MMTAVPAQVPTPPAAAELTEIGGLPGEIEALRVTEDEPRKGRTMSLYIVSDDGQDQWLTYVDTENPGVYAYVANLGRFVFHKPLGQDFYWDRELDWAPVDTAAARKIITDGVLGKLDGHRHDALLSELEAEPDQRSVEDVFGASPSRN